MFDTTIATRLRNAGLSVIEVDGWANRGSSSFTPRGSVNHHTAGPATGNIPSLNTLIYGRSDLPGPLCNVAQARNNDIYVIAAGRANHAGEGGWNGLSGNSSVWGLEVENVGTNAEPWRPDQIETMARVHAALIRGVADADMCCQHKEWAPNRKPDAHDIDGNNFRTKVAAYLGGTPEPNPEPGGFDMFIAIDSVALCALMGNVLFTFTDMNAYGEAKNASPSVPALVIGGRTPIADRQHIYSQLLRQHIVAVGEGDSLT